MFVKEKFKNPSIILLRSNISHYNVCVCVKNILEESGLSVPLTTQDLTRGLTYIYIYIMVRVFTNGLIDRSSILG